MNPFFKKLNYKDQPLILAVNHPASFQLELDEMMDIARIETDASMVEETQFAIVFVTTQEEINHWVPAIVSKLKGDGVLWFCYPKGTSRKYKCDFNRDTGWEIMGAFNMEGVRQVAIDEDWSALRFRNVKYIKTLTRSKDMALSEEAKKRVSKK